MNAHTYRCAVADRLDQSTAPRRWIRRTSPPPPPAKHSKAESIVAVSLTAIHAEAELARLAAQGRVTGKAALRAVARAAIASGILRHASDCKPTTATPDGKDGLPDPTPGVTDFYPCGKP